VPEPILMSIATTLATKTATSLYELVKTKFANRKQALATLEAAKGAAPGSPQLEALAAELHDAGQSDPGFAKALQAGWDETQVNQHATEDAVANQISGTVSGHVVQARDIQGGVSFGA
jgi:hypothetical protein